MHSYQPLWPEDRKSWKPPSPADFTYRDALDVGRFAALDPLTTWHTCPHIWHLDDKGRWRCCSKGSSLDSVQSFAEDPADLLACRRTRTGNRCPNYWVILEPPMLFRSIDECHSRWGIFGFSVLEVPNGDFEELVRVRPIVAVRRQFLVADGESLVTDGFPLLPTLKAPHWTVVLAEPTPAQFVRVRSHFRGPVDNPLYGAGKR